MSSNPRDVQNIAPVQQLILPASQQLAPDPYSSTLEQQPASGSKTLLSEDQKSLVSVQEPPVKAPHTSKYTDNRGFPQLGFKVSGLCVITSALLLLFVYFMSLSLPPLNGPSNVDSVGTAT